jgi:O-antigen/teichoic acid export membrane protein
VNAPSPSPAPAAPAERGFARDTLVLAVGLGAAQLITLGVMPLWSRQYGVADFAALGVWASVVAVVSMALLLRYDTCIVIAKTEAEARALLRLCLGLSLGGGALLALAAWALPGSWQAALGLQPLGDWLPLAVLGGALAAAFAALLAWANRRRAYPPITGARIVLAVGAAVAGTAFGAWGVAGGLLLAQLLGGVLGLAALALLLARGPAAKAHGVSAPEAEAVSAAEAARRHPQAPRYLWPSAMLDAVTQQLPMLLAVAWFSTAEAGPFSLAWRVLAVPVLMVAGAAGTVFYERFARLAAQDRVAARALLLRTWRAFALIGLPPTVLLLVFGEPLFAWAFGAEWRSAGALAAVLAPMLCAMLVSSPTSGALIVLGLQKWSPVFGLAMLAYRPMALWIGAQQGSLALGLALWGLCEIVAIALYNLLLLRTLRRPAV